jgi:DNA (cytosine-5)-methyltransferase 1
MTATGIGVQRLLPIECERLQGFPDNYALIPYRGKPATDSPRYKALGNAFPVPVVRWIGERIEAEDKRILKEGI